MATPQTEAVHTALQRAISAVEAKIKGDEIDLEGADLEELALFASAAINLCAVLVTSSDRPDADTIEALRMLALTAATS